MSYTAWSVSQDEIPDTTKWNYLGGNDAHFYSFLGDNLAWQSWTPTWSGITVGNSTTVAYYTQVGKTVFCRIRFVRGSTGVMTSTPIFTLPVTAKTIYQTYSVVLGTCYFEDLATLGYTGTTRSVSTTTAQFIPQGCAGTYITNTAVTTTVPFTWGTSDYITSNFFYEAA